MRSVGRQLRSLLEHRGVVAAAHWSGAGMFAVGVAVIVWVHVHGGGRGLSEDQVELAGLVAACLGWLIYIWARHATDTWALRQLHISGSQLSLLANQAPADVWTTDAELRLTSVFGALPARLEAPGARVPDRTLYEVFGTRDAGHPVIAAHLRALRGESATYERVAGDLVLEGRVDPLRDDRARVVGCVGVAVDVTARKQAEEQGRFLGTIAEQTADAIIVTDTDHRIVYTNVSAEGLFGYSAEEFLGRTPDMLNAEPDAREIQNQINKDVASGNPHLGTLLNRRKDGSTFVCEFRVAPMRDADGRICAYIGVGRDATERVRAAEMIARIASFPQLNPMPIVEMDAAGKISFMNPAAERLLPDLRAVSPVHPFVADAWTLVREAQCEGTVSRSREVRVGETRYLQDLYALPDHSHLRIYASDIAERKRAEDALRRSQTELRALARRLQSVREDEHTVMAREIHDELGQNLTALRLDLSWLARKFPEASAAVRQKIRAMVALTDDTIDAGRRIVAELRPPILDDLGLAPSLEWYVQNFAKRAGLRYEWDPGPAGLVVDRELAVVAYRIVQESLTNVARHAQAKHVAVRLGEKDGAVTIEIRDDGRGISEDAVTSPHSLGIVGMRERALVRGGSLAVCRLPGGGTSVRVTIPNERREPRETA